MKPLSFLIWLITSFRSQSYPTQYLVLLCGILLVSLELCLTSTKATLVISVNQVLVVCFRKGDSYWIDVSKSFPCDVDNTHNELVAIIIHEFKIARSQNLENIVCYFDPMLAIILITVTNIHLIVIRLRLSLSKFVKA